ncbi:hypothetical protein V6N13_094801 [Hibiscus sabdariffa]
MVMAMAVPISACGVSLQCTNSSSYSSGKGCKYAGQSVRALPIRILTVGKTRLPGVQLLVDEYIAKLRRFCHVDDVQVRANPKNARNTRAQVDDEDTALVNLIRSDDWVVMLDECGLDIDSEQMAELLGDAGNTGASRLSFCIGGPYGHGQQVRNRANVSIKLSSMVMDYSERTKVPSLALISGQASSVGNTEILFFRLLLAVLFAYAMDMFGGCISRICNKTSHWECMILMIRHDIFALPLFFYLLIWCGQELEYSAIVIYCYVGPLTPIIADNELRLLNMTVFFSVSLASN